MDFNKNFELCNILINKINSMIIPIRAKIESLQYLLDNPFDKLSFQNHKVELTEQKKYYAKIKSDLDFVFTQRDTILPEDKFNFHKSIKKNAKFIPKFNLKKLEQLHKEYFDTDVKKIKDKNNIKNLLKDKNLKNKFRSLTNKQKIDLIKQEYYSKYNIEISVKPDTILRYLRKFGFSS